MPPFRATVAILVVVVLLHLPRGATSIPTHEVDAMLASLHSRGPYNLIANAIATSDLLFDILRSSSFTLFAPPDSSLFPLALTLPSSSYVAALCLHSSPRRYSYSDLRQLVSSSSAAARAIPTLLTPRSLRLHAVGSVLALNNVEVSFPGIFYSHSIAVHGISGAISLRDERHISPPPSLATIPGMYDRLPGHGHFFRIPRFGNRTDHSLQNHGDVAASPVGFTPAPAPAPMLKRPVSSKGFAPVPAPAPIKIGEANNNAPDNVQSSEILSPSIAVITSQGVDADPVDLDTLDDVHMWNGGVDSYALDDVHTWNGGVDSETLDEVHTWNGGDIDSLFDEFL